MDELMNYQFLHTLESIIASRTTDATDTSYTSKLMASGLDRILKKIGEESGEVIIAGKNQDAEEIKNETSDLVFHLLVFLRQQGLSFQDIVDHLEKRHQARQSPS